MKQIIQNLSNGDISLIDAPMPTIEEGYLLIDTTVTLISPGTERMLVEFGKASLLSKAKQQPERVKMVLEKVRADGLISTVGAVRSRLDQPVHLGYSNVGIVREVGRGVRDFRVGDRVVSNGPHAEIVKVPTNLCALVPDQVEDDFASFTVISAIALQGVRLVAPSLGESVAVIGVGLVGLLTVQLLKAHGCRVLAIDKDKSRLELANQFGAEICNVSSEVDVVDTGIRFSKGSGVDAVIIAASTNSSDPVSQAARMSRKRGRIVLVGVTGLELNRTDFYEKELTFQVSCSYGPGRYDKNYEEKGNDYPLPYVRWTENRNFTAVLDLMAERRLDIQPLISHRFELGSTDFAYEKLLNDKSAVGILLVYGNRNSKNPSKTIPTSSRLKPHHTERSVVGFVGAGNHASRVLIPAFKSCNARLHTIVSLNGFSSAIQAQKSGFEYASTDLPDMLGNPEISTVVVSTRHNSHAEIVVKSLNNEKHVFVEKPLCLSQDELSQIREAYFNSNGILMVGFNRRFAPLIKKIKSLLENDSGKKCFIMTVNAGHVPSDHWAQDKDVGGGRIIGEGCHFIDLLRFLAGSQIASYSIQKMPSEAEDTATISLGFSDGSVGSIHYFSNGSRSFQKERLEVFTNGKVLQLNNFRRLRGFGWPNFRKMNLWKQDKGQGACVSAFLDAVENSEPAPIPFDEIEEVSNITLKLSELI